MAEQHRAGTGESAERRGLITRALEDCQLGTDGAEERLWEQVYEWLKLRARQLCARESGQNGMVATELLHEAYQKLRGSKLPACGDSQHFMRVATNAMRQVLVDFGRKRRRQAAVPWSQERFAEIAAGGPLLMDESLDLAEAIAVLAEAEPRLARVVGLRTYGGLTIAECASVVGASPRWVDGAWARSRIWLYRRLTGAGSE